MWRIKSWFWGNLMSFTKSMVDLFDSRMDTANPEWASKPYAKNLLRGKLWWKRRWYKASANYARSLGFEIK